MNTKQWSLLAVALCAWIATTDASAAPVTMRTILRYSLGAWVSPAAVVLRSPEEWTQWNDAMAENERAVAAEPLPPGVDWSKEVLLVVAIGEVSTIATFELDPPQRVGRTLYFTGRLERSWTQSFSSPCHVVALDRRFADSIVLDPGIGTLEDPFGPVSRRSKLTMSDGAVLAAEADGGAAVTTVEAHPRSWGAVKHLYR